MSISILAYHDVSFKKSVLSTPVEIFRSQMDWLKIAGFEVLPLSEIVSRINQGSILPERAVCITFDDGLSGVYDHAFPILRYYGYPAVLFLVTAFCGRENNWPGQPEGLSVSPMVNWQQVQEMEASGLSVGSHTMSHPRLDQLDESWVQIELNQSKEEIASHLNHSVDWFAYPYGRYDARVLESVRSLFLGACATKMEKVDGRSDPHILGRIDAYYLQNPLAFHLLDSQLFTIYLSIRRILRKVGNLAFDRSWN
jgi:peptidoglycan/xylan/chitin deacetylase (PgdA/CDA1 family)